MTLPRSRIARVAFGTVVLLAVMSLGASAADNLNADMQKALRRVGLTGQGAVVVVLKIDATGNVTTQGQGVYGVRRVDSTDPIKVTDQFLVASCGKSFTASVWGVLVTQGLVKWTDTIGSILTANGISKAGMKSTYTGSTLAQLLSHRAGFADNTDWDSVDDDAFIARMKKVPTDPAQRTAIRMEYALYSLTEDPGTARGKFEYSNIGYNVASWLSELVSGQNWETMITTFFLQPMGMNAAFGLPYNKYPLDNVVTKGPVGQDCSDKHGLSLPAYDWEAYSPFGMGSGGIYMTVGDLANWVSWHVRGLKGLLSDADYALLSFGAFKELHKAYVGPSADNDGDYAKGWYNDTDRMQHDGSYGGFRTTMIGITQEDDGGNTLALAASTNLSEDGDDGSCSDAVSAVLDTLTTNLIAKYMPSAANGSKRRRVLRTSTSDQKQARATTKRTLLL